MSVIPDLFRSEVPPESSAVALRRVHEEVMDLGAFAALAGARTVQSAQLHPAAEGRVGTSLDKQHGHLEGALTGDLRKGRVADPRLVLGVDPGAVLQEQDHDFEVLAVRRVVKSGESRLVEGVGVSAKLEKTFHLGYVASGCGLAQIRRVLSGMITHVDRHWAEMSLLSPWNLRS